MASPSLPLLAAAPAPNLTETQAIDVKPTFLCSAVLVAGSPSSISEGVVRRAQANLPPPSALARATPVQEGEEEPWTAVLDGEAFEIPREDGGGRRPRRVEMKLLRSGEGRKGKREWDSWSTNSYQSSVDPYTGKSEKWETVEIPSLECFLPPREPLDLFGGFCALAVDNITQVVEAFGSEQWNLFSLLFQAFGGKILEKNRLSEASIIFALGSSSVSKYLRQHGSSASHLTFVHPYWITSCISKGHHLPTSVFTVLEPFEKVLRMHPVTGSSLSIGPNPQSSVSRPFDFVLSYETGTNLTFGLRAPFKGRRIFFEVESACTPSELTRAVMGFVERCGATVVSRPGESHWIVTSHRTGAGYDDATHHPTKTLGTLHHLLQHLLLPSLEILDSRSNLLYFPFPFDPSIKPLRNLSFYISKRYSSDFRSYLTELIRIQGGTVCYDEERGSLRTIIITKDRKHAASENLESPGGAQVTSEFVERSFRQWLPHEEYYSVKRMQFEDPRLACFAPRESKTSSLDIGPSPVFPANEENPYSLESRWAAIPDLTSCPCQTGCYSS